MIFSVLFAGDTFELSEEDLAWTGPRNRWEQLQLGPVVQHNQADPELGLIFFSISQPKNREFLLKTQSPIRVLICTVK